MSVRKPILVGGAAAAIIAGAAHLFAPMRSAVGIERASTGQFAAARSAFADVLAAEGKAQDGLEAFGLVAGKLPDTAQATLYSERDGDCLGRGVYWIDGSARLPLAIAAPHRGSDRHTGALAAALFAETGARAAAWNSAPRNERGDCVHAIDLAREREHLFSAFTLGFADAEPSGLMVQLHGFEGDKRETVEAQEAGMIVSNGTPSASPLLLDLADCLSIAFAPRPVLVYPNDTGELGALTNAQGKLLNEAGFGGFVHLEIAADLRTELVKDADKRALLGSCLVEVSA